MYVARQLIGVEAVNVPTNTWQSFQHFSLIADDSLNVTNVFSSYTVFLMSIYLYLCQNKGKPCQWQHYGTRKRKSKRYICCLYVSIMSWTRKNNKKKNKQTYIYIHMNIYSGNCVFSEKPVWAMSTCVYLWGVCQSKKNKRCSDLHCQTLLIKGYIDVTQADIQIIKYPQAK